MARRALHGKNAGGGKSPDLKEWWMTEISQVTSERVTECRACNGYCRLSDKPADKCRYCNGKGYSRDTVARPLTDKEEAYILELLADGTLEKGWDE